MFCGFEIHLFVPQTEHPFSGTTGHVFVGVGKGSGSVQPQTS
jgi:hypothetical protein